MILGTKLTIFLFAVALIVGIVELLRAAGGEGSTTSLALGVSYLSVAIFQLTPRNVSQALIPATQRAR